jgi:hypothetical protein
MNNNRCPKCRVGVMMVYTTRVNERAGSRVQYRKCNCCSHTDKNVVSLSRQPVQWTRRKNWIGRSHV